MLVEIIGKLSGLLVFLVATTVYVIQNLMLDVLALVAQHRVFLPLVVDVLLVVLLLQHLLVVALFVLLLQSHDIVGSLPRLLDLFHKLFLLILKHLYSVRQKLRVVVDHLPRVLHP